MKPLLFYLKTTETCNLNCSHCFTNGSNGARIFWDHEKTAAWIKRFHAHAPKTPLVHFEFHGGEPFLADLGSMQYVYDQCHNLWANQTWGATTNLVYKLDTDKIDFIQGPLAGRLGTSWDPDIRFANPKQYDLWRKNLETLLGMGIRIKLFISVTKGTIKIKPIDLLEWVRDLGVQEMALERLTMNGSAVRNLEIFPSNLEQDQWFLKMHQAIEENQTRSWFDNDFFETIYSKFETGNTSQGTFCRDCEEKLFTINADGTIAGCPNSAPEQSFGHLDDSIQDLLTSPKRIENIACERARDPRCYSCEVFQYCNSDCHQLEWQGNVCGAPKSVMTALAGINTKRRVIPVLTL